MPAIRLRSLSLLAAGILVFGACSSGSGSAAPSGASADCAGSRHDERRQSQRRTDVVEGKFNVAMVLIGPHDDGGWSQAHYEGLQYVSENVPDAHTAYIKLVPEGADSEQVFRSLGAQGLRLHHRDLVRVHGPDRHYRGRTDPGRDIPAPDRLQVQLQELRQLLRGDGGLQVPRRHAGRIRGRQGRQHREDRLHGHVSPSPKSCASATRSCAASR